MQEVFGFEGYGHALHRNFIVGPRVVANVCPHGKGHGFGLWGPITGVKVDMVAIRETPNNQMESITINCCPSPDIYSFHYCY